MPNFILTDKGYEYYEELRVSDIFSGDNLPEEETVRMQKLRDYTTLEMAREDVLDDKGLMVNSKTYKPVIRRLFEAGYIDYV